MDDDDDDDDIVAIENWEDDAMGRRCYTFYL